MLAYNQEIMVNSTNATFAIFFRNGCCFQTAVAMVSIQHRFRRQGVPSEQSGDVLLHLVAVCHVADGRHNDSNVWLSIEQIHWSYYADVVHLVHHRRSATAVRSFTLCTVFLTQYIRSRA